VNEEVQLTDDGIRALRSEAGQAGDLDMVTICDRALNGDHQAICEVARVIADARARGE
jgi:hypothetical protein